MTPEDIREMKEDISRLERGVQTRFAQMQIHQLHTFITNAEALAAQRPAMTASPVHSNMEGRPQEGSPHETQDMSMIDPQLAIDQQLNEPNTSMLANQPSPAGPPLAPDTIEALAETPPTPDQGVEAPVNLSEAAVPASVTAPKTATPLAPAPAPAQARPAQAPAVGAMTRHRQESEAAPHQVMGMFADVESIDVDGVGEGTKKEIIRFEAIFGHLQDLAEKMTGKEDEEAIFGASWVGWNDGHRLVGELKKQFEKIMTARK